MDYIIVQAGGKGTRLGYLTENKPKALVPVDNLPMLFHLFKKYSNKKFIIIADYKKEVLREYLDCFANVKYRVIDAKGVGTCAGIKQSLELVPEGQAFMLVWSDLILSEHFELPGEYLDDNLAINDYIGISQTFECRWSYADGRFYEEKSSKHGVAGFFLFTDKAKLKDISMEGELVRWMQERKMTFDEIGLAGTKEFGLLEEYEKLSRPKCRPFNRIIVDGDYVIKKPVDSQGENLAGMEQAWYKKAAKLGIKILPKIFESNPLKMEHIKGSHIFENNMSQNWKHMVLEILVNELKQMHQSDTIAGDIFSMKEVYFYKTFDRLNEIRDMLPFADGKYINVNGKKCRNVFFYKRELERAIEKLECREFSFIHGDCTFSNIILKEEDGMPVLIDPRGYFGHTQLYGDVRYDWAKLYYSIIGNYDRFNRGDFRLNLGNRGIELRIESNCWEHMEEEFFKLTGADRYEIKLIHAVIWLSLTTYAWHDYDSVCGAFYNGLYYLEDVL
ncbi:MAG: NTP transferase domain-containing protein [Lachnospiraceae bacterium]|nr:NTP transferase domain-containing protein [Lachnospiraceae bacterium]